MFSDLSELLRRVRPTLLQDTLGAAVLVVMLVSMLHLPLAG